MSQTSNAIQIGVFGQTEREMIAEKPASCDNQEYVWGLLSDSQDQRRLGNTRGANQLINRAKFFLCQDRTDHR